MSASVTFHRLTGLLAAVVLAAGCSDSTKTRNRNSAARGTYALLAMEHARPPSPDVVTAAGGAVMDGLGNGLLTYRNSKNQNFSQKDRFTVDMSYRVDADKADPGAITPDGQFMFRVRKTANPSIWLFHREARGATTSLVSGSYHYVGYRHVNGGPGLLTAFGTASFTGSGGWTVRALLSNQTLENRAGSVTVSSIGVTTAVEGTDTYLGFTDLEGNLVAWLDLELVSGPYIRLDVFIRTGVGMHQATLNGTYNLGRFFQGSVVETPGSGFGTISFDGKGSWTMTYEDQQGTARSAGGTYVMASNGAATLTSATGTLQAFLTPNPDRRVLFICDADVSNGEIGFFVATDR